MVVFHSLFLSTCEQRRSVRSVYIGHYVLPPASIQDGEKTALLCSVLLCSLIGCKSYLISASNCCDLPSLILRSQRGGWEVNLGVWSWASWNRGKYSPLNLEFTHYTTLPSLYASFCLASLLLELEFTDGWWDRWRVQQKWVCNVPGKMFRLQCDTKALSLFGCCSLYSVQPCLTHTHMEVKTLCVQIGMIL